MSLRDIPTPPSPEAQTFERVVRRGARLRLRRRIARGVSVLVMAGIVSGSAVAAVLHRDGFDVEQSLETAIAPPPEVSFAPVPSPAPPSGPLASPSRHTSRVLVPGGPPANGPSDAPVISENGRFVAFVSAASNLAPGAVVSDQPSNIFVRDLEMGSTVLASVGTDGRALTAGAGRPSLSADGSLVAFAAAEEAGGESRVYVRDLAAGRTILVSADNTGRPVAGRMPAISGDGSSVAFVSDDPALVLGDLNTSADVFVARLLDRAVELASANPDFRPADGVSGVDGTIGISRDGRFVVFASAATDLAPGDDGAGGIDVFLRDTVRDATIMVSRPTSLGLSRRSSRPAISADASTVAYTRFVEGRSTRPHAIVLAWSRITGHESLVSATSREEPLDAHPDAAPSVSANGRFVAFTTATGRVLVRDRSAGATTTASLTDAGRVTPGARCGASGAGISGGGGYVAFACEAAIVAADANGYPDVFVRDRRRSTTVVASVGTSP